MTNTSVPLGSRDGAGQHAYSVFGASGLIGSAICREFQRKGHDVRPISRGQWPSGRENLGHVIFAIGLTADFRQRPLATVDAHICSLLRALESFEFDSFLYLSSTRVYKRTSYASESADLSVCPSDPDDFYNVTKIAGEAVCMAIPRPTVRIARISNVVTPFDNSGNFLSAVLTAARDTGHVTMLNSHDSEKDYIDICEVIRLIESITMSGKHRIYNVASGHNVTHSTVAQLISTHLSASVTFSPQASRLAYPMIVVDRIRSEFGLNPEPFEVLFNRFIAAE